MSSGLGLGSARSIWLLNVGAYLVSTLPLLNYTRAGSTSEQVDVGKCRVHNLKVGGSNSSPATNLFVVSQRKIDEGHMESGNLPFLMTELRRSAADDNRLTAAVAPVHKKKGRNIFKEGDKGRFMFIVVKGAVDIKSKGSLLATVGPGDVFGEMALVRPDSLRTADAVAKEDSELIPIHQQRFLQLIKKEPELAVEVIRLFVSRLMEANEKIATGVCLIT